MYTISYNPSDERASFSNFFCKTRKGYKLEQARHLTSRIPCVWKEKVYRTQKMADLRSLVFKIKSLLVNPKVGWGFQLLKSWKELRINTKVGQLADFQPHVTPHDIRKSVKGQHDCWKILYFPPLPNRYRQLHAGAPLPACTLATESHPTPISLHQYKLLLKYDIEAANTISKLLTWFRTH